jgi:hypothetical protein
MPGLFHSHREIDMVRSQAACWQNMEPYQMSELSILNAFAELPDTCRTAGQRHTQSLCLALFTLSVAAGNRGFIAIGDWVRAYHDELVALFKPPKGRLPPYSTIRRALLRTEYVRYGACLSQFFGIELTLGNPEINIRDFSFCDRPT